MTAITVQLAKPLWIRESSPICTCPPHKAEAWWGCRPPETCISHGGSGACGRRPQVRVPMDGALALRVNTPASRRYRISGVPDPGSAPRKPAFDDEEAHFAFRQISLPGGRVGTAGA